MLVSRKKSYCEQSEVFSFFLDLGKVFATLQTTEIAVPLFVFSFCFVLRCYFLRYKLDVSAF
jgi:hypothetical protein